MNFENKHSIRQSVEKIKNGLNNNKNVFEDCFHMSLKIQIYIRVWNDDYHNNSNQLGEK